jgi:heptaprenyl diphosphate synthase
VVSGLGTVSALPYGRGVAPGNPLLEHPTVHADLERVELALRAAVRTEDAFLTEMASHLITAGGKRGRPAFAIGAAATSAATIAPVSDDVIQGAVAVELVHLGSLYHDDVMDEARTRRTVESVNARWGNLQAILAGDFLLARASEIAASLGTEVAGLLAATIGRLCEGQVRELQHTYDVDRTEQAYLASITGKTASLFSTACRIGAIVAERPRGDIDSLTRFGKAYGMAFQIVDDILDVVASDAQLGKPAGHDLIEGVYTLPVIRTLGEDNESAKHLRDLLGTPLPESTMHEARAIVRRNGSVTSSLTTAEAYATEAKAALADLDDSDARRGLGGATEHLLLHTRDIVATAA